MEDDLEGGSPDEFSGGRLWPANGGGMLKACLRTRSMEVLKPFVWNGCSDIVLRILWEQASSSASQRGGSIIRSCLVLINVVPVFGL